MLLKFLLAATGGVLLGLLLTLAALKPEVRGASAGPWRGSPRDGAVDADPYALAAIERAGTLPPGAAEGIGFVAAADSAGAPLDANCTYRLAGPVPPARYWTLSVLTPEGFPLANPAGRYSFTSAEMLRDADGQAAIAVGPQARSGNWLPVGAASRFVLALHLYDTGLSAAGAGVSAAAMPALDRIACR